MTASRPLLTIAVPTYNRAPSLRRSLTALVRQLDALEDGWNDVELLVSDNCSTDDTPQVFAAIGDRPSMRYARNAENVGMEGNFIACFERARGTYVWTFSDDDLLIDGALHGVVGLLRSQPTDLIYVPARYLFGELDAFDASAVPFELRAVSGDVFALRANGVLSFLSSVIVNKDRYLALQGDVDLRRYKGTFLAHYEWIYTLLARGQHFRISSQPLIRARTGATGGYDLFEVFGEHYVRIGRDKLPHCARMRTMLEKAMLQIHIPNFIIRCRENSFGRFQYDPQRAAEKIVQAYGRPLFYRLLLRPMLFGSDRSAAWAYVLSRWYARGWSLARRLWCRLMPSLPNPSSPHAGRTPWTS